MPHICARWGSAPMVAATLATTGNVEWTGVAGGVVRGGGGATGGIVGGESGAAVCELTRLVLTHVPNAKSTRDGDAYPINWLRNQASKSDRKK